MNGWGSTGLNVTPDGTVLPCHAAETIPHLTFDKVTDRPLAEIWYDGAAFNAYRGTDWLPALCQGCERRDIDFGGCRCQAMAVLGDAAASDPVCTKSPGRAALDALLTEEVQEVAAPASAYRRQEAGMQQLRQTAAVAAIPSLLIISPAPPACTIVCPMASRTGLARSNASASPPTMNVSVPPAAAATPPETGASTIAKPATAALADASLASSTALVKQSINPAPAGISVNPTASPK